MQKTSALFSLAIIALLSGCATSQTLSDADRSRIKSVTLNSKIESVPLDYDTIAVATSEVLSKWQGNVGEEGKAIEEYMARHGITIEDVVRNEFVRQWKSRQIFSLVDKDGDAEITLSIYYYILAQPNMFSPALRVGIGVEALIKDKAGKELWRKRSGVKPLNSSFPKHSWDEMEANPELFREMGEGEARQIIKELLDDLEKS
ncbi:MAG TPA: hypothetical protein VK717_03980 [Opitutaceae bacterium]|jgi:hypothetical protein|nr:hypothetical protein [Opitutaceae bacterium]